MLGHQTITAAVRRGLHASPRGVVEAAILAAALVTAEPSYRSLIVGASVSLLGEVLRLSAAGYGSRYGSGSGAPSEAGRTALTAVGTQLGRRLRGPYRCLRHPYLAGSALLFVGLCLAGRNLYVTIGALLALTAVYWPVYRRAESRLAQDFGPWYPRYRAMVPALLPGWPCPVVGVDYDPAGSATSGQQAGSGAGTMAPSQAAARFAWDAAFLRGRHRELDALLAMLGAGGLLYALCWTTLRQPLHVGILVVLVLSALGRFGYYAWIKRPEPRRRGI